MGRTAGSQSTATGKQADADGKHLAQVEDPHETQTYTPSACGGCGGDLASAELLGIERREAFDLPPIRPFVTEHRMECRLCACGCETKAAPPKEATAPGCFGPGVRALSVYQHLPYDRMAQLFGDVLGIEVSVGALTQRVAEAGGALGLATEVIRDLLIRI